MDFPSVKRAAVTSAPSHTCRQGTRVSGRSLKTSANRTVTAQNDSEVFSNSSHVADTPICPKACAAAKLSAALRIRETSSRNPVTSTTAREEIRYFTIAQKWSWGGVARQMEL